MRRLLAVAEERTEASLRSCLEGLGETTCKQVQFVCSDMWKPYLNVIAEKLGDAIHVLDRFHIMQKFGKAIDEIRAEEAKRLERDGYEPVLKRSRWCFLKRPENRTDKETVKLSEILQYNLRTVRAFLRVRSSSGSGNTRARRGRGSSSTSGRAASCVRGWSR